MTRRPPSTVAATRTARRRLRRAVGATLWRRLRRWLRHSARRDPGPWLAA